ncbi:hypothetical protein PPERSA_10601 [Pseudocohnilembus persalinus]|uniref:P-loop containing nucleoside triphosphate hydrolase n=1 Tax=Pseudocohnilembus persalinus TaxID=266149 RepID=A0A0V0Q9E2_PSEPJ|nr:hypothetical protein PPERSA_10601 [Pseudocohnilembus persalinus]|eukprot:KRW98830.1 hypothetical protein PPERSA_10601 [Pseudocohnilembus persalinus]
MQANEKNMLIQSMIKLIEHIYNNQNAKEEIFSSISQEDLNKLLENMEDQNSSLRKISCLFLCELLSDSYENQTKFCESQLILPLNGRVTINKIPQGIIQYLIKNPKLIENFPQQDVKQDETLCWFYSQINATHGLNSPNYFYRPKKQITSLKSISQIADEFLDPKFNLIGFEIKKNQINKQNNQEKILQAIPETKTIKNNYENQKDNLENYKKHEVASSLQVSASKSQKYNVLKNRHSVDHGKQFLQQRKQSICNSVRTSTMTSNTTNSTSTQIQENYENSLNNSTYANNPYQFFQKKKQDQIQQQQQQQDQKNEHSTYNSQKQNYQQTPQKQIDLYTLNQKNTYEDIEIQNSNDITDKAMTPQQIEQIISYQKYSQQKEITKQNLPQQQQQQQQQQLNQQNYEIPNQEIQKNFDDNPFNKRHASIPDGYISLGAYLDIERLKYGRNQKKLVIIYQNDQSYKLPLLNIQIPNNQAGKIAKDVKKQLVRENRFEIPHQEMEQVLFQQIHKNGFSQNHITRYEMTSKFFRTRVPLIILLGGAPKVGKSMLSTYLAERLNISNVLQTSIVQTMMKTLDPKYFENSFDINQESETEQQQQSQIHYYQKTCQTVRKGVHADIYKSLTEGKPLIIEDNLEKLIYVQNEFQKFIAQNNLENKPKVQQKLTYIQKYIENEVNINKTSQIVKILNTSDHIIDEFKVIQPDLEQQSDTDRKQLESSLHGK